MLKALRIRLDKPGCIDRDVWGVDQSTVLASRIAAALVFLDLNGIQINADADAVVEIVMRVAQGKGTKAEVARFLRGHVKGRKS